MTDSAFIKRTASGAKTWGRFILAIATAQSELCLCTVVVEHLPAFICADRVSITHLTNDGTTFKITAVNGAKQVLVQGQQIPFEETNLQLAITTQQPQLFEAQSDSPYFDLRELEKQGMVQVIHVPLVLFDPAIGSLNISVRTVIADPAAVIEFMEQIAILLAMNLERHTLYHQTRCAMERYRFQAE